MQFVLPVLENGVRQRHSTTLHIMLAFLLFGIGVAVEGLYWFTAISKNFKESGPYKPFLFFGIACLAMSLLIIGMNVFQKSWLRKETNNLLFRIIELALLAVSSLLFFLNSWQGPAILFGLMSVVVIFAIMRERKGTTGGQIIVDEKGIQLHESARRKFVPWKEIESVILRFSILTIEYSDNHLLQQSIGSPALEATAFEAFCKEKIEAHKLERVSDEW